MPEYNVRRVVRPLTEAQLLLLGNEKEKQEGEETPSDSTHPLTAMFGRFEHQWIHWRIDPSSQQPAEQIANAIDNTTSSSEFSPPPVVAVCLERVSGNDSEGAAAYNGQSWFSRVAPPISASPLEQSLDEWWLGGMRQNKPAASQAVASNKARSPVSSPTKRDCKSADTSKSVHGPKAPSSNSQPQVSAQYSFPLSSFARVATELRRTIHGAEPESRRPVVIEIKFLRQACHVHELCSSFPQHPRSHTELAYWCCFPRSLCLCFSLAEQRTFCAPNALGQPCQSKNARAAELAPRGVLAPENVVVCFNLLWKCSPKDPLLVAVQQTLESQGGLPHLGKLHLPVSTAARPRPPPAFMSTLDCLRTAAQPRVGISVRDTCAWAWEAQFLFVCCAEHLRLTVCAYCR